MQWLDVAVAVVLAGIGIAVAVVLAFDGGSAVEVLLVLVLFGACTLYWTRTSAAWDVLRRR